MTHTPAFEAYVAERRPALFRFAVVLSGDPAVAEDLVQDVLARAFERWDRVAAAQNPHAYIRRMIVNEYTDRWRRFGRTSSHAELEAFLAPVADHAQSTADALALVAELRQLPRQQRAAVVLRYFEGLSYAEIAETLGCRENGARSNVSRGLSQLRIELTGERAARCHPSTSSSVREAQS